MATNGVNGADVVQNGAAPHTTQNGVETMDEIDKKIAQIEVKEPKKKDKKSENVPQSKETVEKGDQNTPEKTETIRDKQEPRKVIYKADANAAPAPSINLGVWGKIPIHTLNNMYLDTVDGCMLTLSEAKMSRSIGGWVYAGAACLAKYLESLIYTEPPPEGGCLRGKRVIELGAGTGVVGVLAGYHGADTIITDLDNIVPLIDYNIQQNQAHMKGNVIAKGLVWGEDVSEFCTKPVDYLILANCVYYEPSLESLATTMRQLASVDTEILVCYEERTMGIKALIGRWHKIIEDDFHIEYLPNSVICKEFKEDFVRLLRMKKKK